MLILFSTQRIRATPTAQIGSKLAMAADNTSNCKGIMMRFQQVLTLASPGNSLSHTKLRLARSSSPLRAILLKLLEMAARKSITRQMPSKTA
jgi:hypothetical protein